MSNPNHIIIPIVKNKPTPEELNVFQSSVLCLTPQKEPPFSKVLVDKKYSSAFKRYKQKKEKREQREEQGDASLLAGTAPKQDKPLKLRLRHLSSLPINKNHPENIEFSACDYFYDPNQAPLFVSDSPQAPHLRAPHRAIPQKTETMQEEIQVQLQQKIKSEPMEEELDMKYVEVNYRDDDPFIIVKKTNARKLKTGRADHHVQKTKQIKKDKAALHSTDDFEKKIKALPEREERKIMPLFQDQLPSPHPLVSEKQKPPSFDRFLNQQKPKHIQEIIRFHEGHAILSLQHILKDASIDQSGKSDEEVQIMEPFLISRAGVMS